MCIHKLKFDYDFCSTIGIRRDWLKTPKPNTLVYKDVIYAYNSDDKSFQLLILL